MRLSFVLPLFFFVFAAPTVKSLGPKRTEESVFLSQMTTNEKKLSKLAKREERLQIKLQCSLVKERIARKQIGSLKKKLGEAGESEAHKLQHQLKAASRILDSAKKRTKKLEKKTLKVAILKHKAATRQYCFEQEARIKQLEKAQRLAHPELIYDIQRLTTWRQHLGIQHLNPLADRKAISAERTLVDDQIYDLHKEIMEIENMGMQNTRHTQAKKASLNLLKTKSVHLSAKFDQLTKSITNLPEELESVKETMDTMVATLQDRRMRSPP